MIKILALLILMLANNIQSLNTDANDLLSGYGLFKSGNIQHFIEDQSHTTSFISQNGSYILKLIKPSTKEPSYTHGISKIFNQSQPTHISFSFSSTTTQKQDTNFRLMSSIDNSTVLLFRAGRAGLIRVNQNQMVAFYNGSITTDQSNIKSTKIDFILYWDSKSIQIFINDKYVSSCKFFNKNAISVDKILVYNLYSSTSYWKNMVVCSNRCYSFNGLTNIISSILMLYIIILTLI